MSKYLLLGMLFLFSILNGCASTTQPKDINDYKNMIIEKFKAKEFKDFILSEPPVLGGKNNIYCTFSDNDNNNFFLVSTVNVGKYILINKSTPIDNNVDSLKKNYNKLIKSITDNAGGEVVLKDIAVYKCESNVEHFNSNKVGFLYLSKTSDKDGDMDKLKASGNYSYDIKVLFNPDNDEHYYIISGIKFL
ncbi:MAG: hypothetical protein N3I35_15220 [Clostridia bacterium]|nr:hypothetical protein [Clostridia bacterium]